MAQHLVIQGHTFEMKNCIDCGKQLTIVNPVGSCHICLPYYQRLIDNVRMKGINPHDIITLIGSAVAPTPASINVASPRPSSDGINHTLLDD